MPSVPLVFFFSSFCCLSVCADRVSIYFDKFCIVPRMDFKSSSYFGIFNFVIVSSLSCSGLVPFWSVCVQTFSFFFEEFARFWVQYGPCFSEFLLLPPHVPLCFVWSLLLYSLAMRLGFAYLFLEICWYFVQSVETLQKTVIFRKIVSCNWEYKKVFCLLLYRFDWTMCW